MEMPGIAAARILEPMQANGFTPQEVTAKRLKPFWKQILQEQALPI
ncbi:MAG: hypothetical protein Q7U74_12940 [Saprospiraceae bacterium]|nr:hypothetical protein [Saprospiraceae bacterium]